jgi:hypothetical protein
VKHLPDLAWFHIGFTYSIGLKLFCHRHVTDDDLISKFRLVYRSPGVAIVRYSRYSLSHSSTFGHFVQEQRQHRSSISVFRFLLIRLINFCGSNSRTCSRSPWSSLLLSTSSQVGLLTAIDHPKSFEARRHSPSKTHNKPAVRMRHSAMINTSHSHAKQYPTKPCTLLFTTVCKRVWGLATRKFYRHKLSALRSEPG